MAKIDIVQLDRELRQGNIRPFYIVVGGEAYLALRSQKMIEEAVTGGNPNDFTRTVFEGKDLDVHKFSDALKSLPLFGSRQLVTVKDAEAISKETLEKLAECFNEPLKTSTAIFIAAKIDGRGRFMQAASKNTQAAVVECKSLYPNQVPYWINMEVKRQGMNISQEGANYLADIAGSDLGALSQAIERLILFVGKRKVIELSDIEEAVAETTQRSIFELMDTIGLRQKGRSIAVLNNLLDFGTQPILILNMMARHFRILTKAKEVDGGCPPAEAAAYLGVKPFFVKGYLEQSRKFSSVELKKKFAALSKCDRELKSSRIPKERILERLILSF
jgi:DNA polymerase-3 subunit delta